MQLHSHCSTHTSRIWFEPHTCTHPCRDLQATSLLAPPLSRPHILVGWVVRDGGIGAMVRASSLPCITSIAHNRAHSLPVEHQPYAQYGLARAVISDAAR